MIIDSHQHFWNYDPIRDSWITDEMAAIRRDFTPSDVEPLIEGSHVNGIVAVQADQTEDETDFLLQLSSENPFIMGVVGWLDLQAENIKERIDYYSEYEKLKGLRHIIQAEPEGFMDKPSFRKGLSLLSAYDWTFDLLIYPHQIKEANCLVRDFPNQKFVIDHLAKPTYDWSSDENWRKEMKTISLLPNVCCKLSGMTTEISNFQWDANSFRPYLDLMLDYFGAERLVFGSDWPVSKLGGSYAEIVGIVRDFAEELSKTESVAIMGGNAQSFYGINQSL